MKKKFWVRKAASFEEADKMDLEDYMAMTPAERLNILQELRENHHKIGNGCHAHRKRLRRVARVIKQA